MFTLVSWVSLGIPFTCAIVIAIDEIRHPQTMWIMNVVWPVTALYFSVFALWGYFRMGRGMAKSTMPGMSMDAQTRKTGQKESARRDPTWRQTAVSDTHCGAGCVIGDVIAEFSLFAFGLLSANRRTSPARSSCPFLAGRLATERQPLDRSDCRRRGCSVFDRKQRRYGDYRRPPTHGLWPRHGIRSRAQNRSSPSRRDDHRPAAYLLLHRRRMPIR
jgi:hypothetical protein